MNQKLVTLKDTGFRMAKIPKVLFHGTTKLRYEVGIPHNGALTSIKNEGLRSDVPPHMKVDLEHLGWVYLCGSIEDAKLNPTQMFKINFHVWWYIATKSFIFY